MKVVICGAGQVGFSIARYLAGNDNDVTIVDINPALVQKAKENLDVSGVVGHASSPQILARAGAAEADMLVAVTQSDEVNMVACQVGHSLFRVTRKIARIRNSDYLKEAWRDLYSQDHLPIDLIISPEEEVAKAIAKRLRVPGAVESFQMVDGLVQVLGVRCTDATPVIKTPLKQIRELFPDLHLQVFGIGRQGRYMVPNQDEEIDVGDEVFFFTRQDQLDRVMTAFGHTEREARKIIVVGGGNIGLSLAMLIEEDYPNVNLKLIELDRTRAQRIAPLLPKTLVLNGNALDAEIQIDAGVSTSETLVAVSNDDEVNILASLLAKRYGTERVVTLINSVTYAPLIGQLGIDSVVSPRTITVSTILREVRQGRVRDVYTLGDGFGEVLEIEALETSNVVGKEIGKLKLPDRVTIGAVVRNGEVMIPKSTLIIEAQDSVVLFAPTDCIRRVEKAFAVQIDFF